MSSRRSPRTSLRAASSSCGASSTGAATGRSTAGARRAAWRGGSAEPPRTHAEALVDIADTALSSTAPMAAIAIRSSSTSTTRRSPATTRRASAPSRRARARARDRATPRLRRIRRDDQRAGRRARAHRAQDAHDPTRVRRALRVATTAAASRAARTTAGSTPTTSTTGRAGHYLAEQPRPALPSPPPAAPRGRLQHRRAPRFYDPWGFEIPAVAQPPPGMRPSCPT